MEFYAGTLPFKILKYLFFGRLPLAKANFIVSILLFKIHAIKSYFLTFCIIWMKHWKYLVHKWILLSFVLLFLFILMVTQKVCFCHIPAFILWESCVFGSSWNGQSFPFAVLSAVCLPQIHNLRYLDRKQNRRGAVLLKSILPLLKASSKQVIPFGKVACYRVRCLLCIIGDQARNRTLT